MTQANRCLAAVLAIATSAPILGACAPEGRRAGGHVDSSSVGAFFILASILGESDSSTTIAIGDRCTLHVASAATTMGARVGAESETTAPARLGATSFDRCIVALPAPFGDVEATNVHVESLDPMRLTAQFEVSGATHALHLAAP